MAVAGAEPCLENEQWQWRGPDGFQARWHPFAPKIELVLAAEDRFRVSWDCLAPGAAVKRTLGNGSGSSAAQDSLSPGLGYLEHLRIESTRSELPFRKLRWGRAHAGHSSLVWIHWARGRDLSVVCEDGVQVDGRIELLPEGGVRVQTTRGEWETGRAKPLGDLRHLFPRWLFRLAPGMVPVQERKMTGPVRLKTNSGEVTGSGVWEEVEWP
ncbi:hypothetical protein SBV1_2170018 [Verrucomicrobia bacterium]|nr:hypothetical protein SBV1_2170018 [Verrucomicrobiota bacterium]